MAKIEVFEIGKTGKFYYCKNKTNLFLYYRTQTGKIFFKGTWVDLTRLEHYVDFREKFIKEELHVKTN